uniref:Uncharacterized protein n=1 Tax=Octopus bimaculoides TaxID=37653 RepID=A0A0L8HBB7_OCTBM
MRILSVAILFSIASHSDGVEFLRSTMDDGKNCQCDKLTEDESK